MRDLFDDWQRYCQGSLDVDKSYFLGLFKIGMTELEELARFQLQGRSIWAALLRKPR